MELHNLKPAKGSVKKRKRIGRGQGSGHGGTSTRGDKGAKSRSGYSKKLGFEGGQMPIQRRLPKFGFKNLNRKEYAAVNLSTIQKLVDDHKVNNIDREVLLKHGIVPKKKKFIKILGNGDLNAKVEIKADAFSESARKAIEEKGGKAINQ